MLKVLNILTFKISFPNKIICLQTPPSSTRAQKTENLGCSLVRRTFSRLPTGVPKRKTG